ncbi:hypothetical protein ACEQPO_27220 [Bacillus sp. SL00103]
MHSDFTELAGLGEELQQDFSQQPLSVNDGGNGLFYGDLAYFGSKSSLLWPPHAFVAVVTYVIIKVVNLFFKIRATEEYRISGLDLTMHGEKAYQD